jgi:anaerobic selenocysteine-containing dehydrogenase
MVRRGERWSSIGWDEALDLATSRLADALDRDGPASVAVLTGGGSLGIGKELIGHFFRALGAVTTVAGGVCGEAGATAQRLDFGDAACHDFTDLVHSGAVVLWGKNPSATSVHLVPFVRAASRRGAPVVVIEVRPSESIGLADRVIRVAPSGDGFLALAVLRRLMDRAAFDPASRTRVENIDDFERFLAHDEMSAERCAALAGDVPMGDIDFLADVYERRSPVATWVGWGLQRRASGGRNIRCIDALCLLSGQVGRPGGGVNFTSTRRRGLDLTALAAPKGRTVDAARFGSELAALDEPPVRFLYVAAANPVTQLPDSTATRAALRRLGFTVVADAFFTDTAEAADLFLPVALMLEEDDVVGSYQHHHVAVVRKVVEPPAGAKPDLWILAEIGRRLGRGDVACVEPAAALERITRAWFAGNEQVVTRNPAHEPVPFADRFPTPSGKARLITERPQGVAPLDGYPLILLTPSCRRWQTSQRFEDDQWGRRAECAVSPRPLGVVEALSDGRVARLESPFGGLEVVLRLDDRLSPETCVVRRGGWVRHGQGVNVLVGSAATDLGGGTAFYDQRVRLVP